MPSLVRPERPDRWFADACEIPTLVHLVTVLVSTILVTRAIRVIESGRPFTGAGVRAWALLSVVLIVGGGIQGVLDTVAVGVVSSLARTHPDGYPDGPWALGGDYQALGTNFPDWPWIFFVLGIIGGGDWIPANDADNWLHLLLGAGMIGLGVLTTRESRVASTA